MLTGWSGGDAVGQVPFREAIERRRQRFDHLRLLGRARLV